MMARRILFVAMQNSPHTARWINLIADQGWDLHLFPIHHMPVLPQIRGVTVHQPWFRLRPRMMLKTFLEDPAGFLRGRYDMETRLNPDTQPVRAILPLPIVPPLDRILVRTLSKPVRLGESDAMAPALYGPHLLARLVRRLRPNLIHSMEFQHCGYNVLRAKEISRGDFPSWLATNWGSDIYYYRNFPDHRRQISRLLRTIDYYSCECQRDVRLARELGLTGKVMPVMPNTGGFDLERVGTLRRVHAPSARRLIIVKGYQHFAGRALTALDALERCADVLKPYELVVFSSSEDVAARARRLNHDGVLNFWITDYLPHDQMLRLQGRARVYIGISISDAISTSMLEAMAMGAFPIQTNTSCCDEWIADGRSGFIVPPDDVDLIADRIRRAVTDDALVSQAAETNWATVQERLDQCLLRKQAVAFYDEIFADLEQRKNWN